MSIFDRFLSKESAPKPKPKLFASTPTKRRFSDLDESAAEAKEKYPDDSKTIEDFVWSLKEACRVRRKKALEGYMEPMRAEPRFFLSKDRLTAYACLLPPENDGEETNLEKFLEDLHYEGIVYGTLQETIPEDFERGYLHIFPVARGKAARAGEDGKVIELFRRRGHMRLEVENGSQVNFGEDMQLQPIRKGTVICLIRAPKPGIDGMDVTGITLPSPQPVSASIPKGENIAFGRDGHALTASVDGILYIQNDLFCIHEQKIIDGDLDNFQGTLHITGNLYIGGNVDGGGDIKASGDIVINGKLGQARVTSLEGTVRIQQGIYGTEGKTFVTAAGQVQTPVMEWAEVDAGTSVITETVSNSVIWCGGTVYAMTGRGMIVNSKVQAKDSILCLRIGNIAGGRSRFSVGYHPRMPESWERVKAEIAETQSTIEKIWEPITSLRRKGSHTSEREKDILKQLVEQRELYNKKMEELKTELRTINKELDKKSTGRIRCEKLFPFLDVQIGKLMLEVTTIEENCNIHVEENSIELE